MLAPVGLTPPVCGACDDRDPFCGCGTPAAAEEQLDPIEHLRREYATVAAHLWEGLRRHGRDHGCAPEILDGPDHSCDLYRQLRRLWVDVNDLAMATAWLLGDGAVPRCYADLWSAQ